MIGTEQHEMLTQSHISSLSGGGRGYVYINSVTSWNRKY